MKRPGILLLNLLIMVGYSVLYMAIGGLIGDEVIGVHWVTLILHILVLFIWGIVNLASGVEQRKSSGGKMLLASLLVALIGHGLCFFNGLLHMGPIH